MNQLVDITNTTQRWPQFDTDAPVVADEIEAARDRYCDAWANDELAEEAYPEPLAEWLSEHADSVLATLYDMRQGDPYEFHASAGRLFRQLEQIVKRQA